MPRPGSGKWIAVRVFYRHIGGELERSTATIPWRLTPVAHPVTTAARHGPHLSRTAPVTVMSRHERLAVALAAGEQKLIAGDVAGAVHAFTESAALAPADVGIAMALANAHQLLGELEARRAALLLAFTDGDWRAVAVAYALGGALLEAGVPHEAALCLEYVRRAHPNDPAALSALASAVRAAGEPERAWPLAKRAAALAPRTGAPLLTAAQVRHDLGDLLGALDWLDKAERARPDHAPTRLQRAYTSLLRGVSAEGWSLFEQRPLPTPDTTATSWTGEPLNGQSVLVTAEQGVGDQFQFLRFLPELAARGAGPITVACHASAVSLLRASGFDAVARGEEPETTWYVPLLSLPHRLGTGAQLFSKHIPYLQAPDVPTPALPSSVPGGQRLGLVWAGNPSFPGRVTRDLDASRLAEVVRIPGVTWISLQHGSAGDVEVPGLHRLPPLPDWATTAAVLRQLDGLVTTDTGIAHLAGAMGVSTWVLLQKVPDWRWGLSGTESRWYPSARLCRQRSFGAWETSITALSQELRAL